MSRQEPLNQPTDKNELRKKLFANMLPVSEEEYQETLKALLRYWSAGRRRQLVDALGEDKCKAVAEATIGSGLTTVEIRRPAIQEIKEIEFHNVGLVKRPTYEPARIQRGKAAEGTTMSFRYEMGLTARDVVTGYEGVITARCDYITGCKQYILSAKGLHDGEPIKGQWFDEDRLSVDKTVSPLRLGFEDKPRTRATGGPQSDSPPIK